MSAVSVQLRVAESKYGEFLALAIKHYLLVQKATLAAAVGPGAPNRRNDVAYVQKLLNRSLHNTPHGHAFAEDGVFGPKTAVAIIEFQRRYLKQSNPDGRIDPNGPTIRSLLVHARKPFPPHVKAFIQMASAGARATSPKWRVPASVLVAQAAHESGWGRRVKSNAYFGVKGKSPTGASTSFSTHEVLEGKSIAVTDEFRAYASFQEAADDYGRFLSENPRYQSCFAHSRNPFRFVEELARAGYATDPDYARKIKNMIRKFGLTDLDH